MKRTTLIITCLLLSFFLPLQAQIFEYIDMDNGLSSRRVLSIQQDKQNYIWILTHKGLDRYNGKQFKHYQLHRCNNPLSFYPNLNFLYTDKDSTIWERWIRFSLRRTKRFLPASVRLTGNISRTEKSSYIQCLHGFRSKYLVLHKPKPIHI